MPNSKDKPTIAVCIPTFNRSKVVEDFLTRCSKYYLEAGIDIYYYDSSPNEDTKKVVADFSKTSDGIHYVKIDSTVHANMKVYKIFQGVGLEKKYDFIWVCGDAIQYSKDGIDYIVSQTRLEYDIIEIDYRDRGKLGRKVYQDYNLYLSECAWELTLFGASMLNTNTILGDVDWKKYEDKYSKPSVINFSHVGLYFSRLAEMQSFKALHLSMNPIDFKSSCYKKDSDWHKDTFFIFCESWVNTINSLPVCYTKKAEAIKRHGTYVLMRNKNDFHTLRVEGIYNFRTYIKYLSVWKKVCNVNTLKLCLISITPKNISKKILGVDSKNRERLEKKLRSFCGKYDKVYLYGAGYFGHAYSAYFDKSNIPFEAFCVSQSGKDVTNLANHPVYPFSEIKEENNIGIVITMGERNAKQVIAEISEYGFNDNVFYEPELFMLIRDGAYE